MLTRIFLLECVNMENFEKYRLGLEEYANNRNNKGQDYLHTINDGVDYQCYRNMMQSMGHILLDENTAFDQMGDGDLKKYEKWLEDGEF